MNPEPPPVTQLLLDQLAAMTTMERGKLTREYRERPSPDGGAPIRLGPYYKLQGWENGRNATRRVPAAEVPALRKALANHERFTALTTAFAEQTIARTRALRGQSPTMAKGAQGPPTGRKRPRKQVRREDGQIQHP